jgi:hypothetical protein
MICVPFNLFVQEYLCARICTSIFITLHNTEFWIELCWEFLFWMDMVSSFQTSFYCIVFFFALLLIFADYFSIVFCCLPFLIALLSHPLETMVHPLDCGFHPVGFQQTVHQLSCGFHPLDCRAPFSFNGCLMDCTPTQLNCAFIQWVSNR